MDKTKKGPIPISKPVRDSLKGIRDILAEKRPDLAEKIDRQFVQGTIDPPEKK